MSKNQSKVSENFDRYKKWFNERDISSEQINRLVAVGLLTEDEKNTILEGDFE